MKPLSDPFHAFSDVFPMTFYNLFRITVIRRNRGPPTDGLTETPCVTRYDRSPLTPFGSSAVGYTDCRPTDDHETVPAIGVVRMKTEYRLAKYALAGAVVLLAMSGVVVVSGLGPDAPILATDGPSNDRIQNNDDSGASTLATTDATRPDADEFEASNRTRYFPVDRADCGRSYRIDDTNVSRTEVQVDGTTITLVYDDTKPFDEIEREQLAELVWADVRDRAAFETYDTVEVVINQFYSTPPEEKPLDAAGITVHPTDRCLPSASGEVNLTDETVDINRVLPELDNLELDVTDEIGVITDEDRGRLEQIITGSDSAAYLIRQQFSNLDTLDATVVEASNDDQIDVELTAPEEDGEGVLMTIDLTEGTVVQSALVLELPESGMEVQQNGTIISFGVNNKTDDS